MRILFSLALLLSLSACFNRVDQFYEANDRVVGNPRVVLNYTGKAQIIPTTQDSYADKMMRLQEQGYIVVGQASFVGEAAREEHLLATAKKNGAFKVLYIKEYRNTENKSFSYNVPTYETTTVSGSAYNYSTGSRVNYSGNVYTSGSETKSFNYSVDKYDQYASFWAKRRPGGMGLYVADLTTEQRKAIGSNMGVSVVAVVKKSSAFRANLIPDDIIVKMDGQTIADVDDFNRVGVQSYGRKDVPMSVVRDGTLYEIAIDVDEKFTYE